MKAFELCYPRRVHLQKNGSVVPELLKNEKNTCRKKKVFAIRPFATEESIQRKREEKAKKQLEQLAEKLGVDIKVAGQSETDKCGNEKSSLTEATKEDTSKNTVQSEASETVEKEGSVVKDSNGSMENGSTGKDPNIDNVETTKEEQKESSSTTPRKIGRPLGSVDTKPRKPRRDKGIKRGPGQIIKNANLSINRISRSGF